MANHITWHPFGHRQQQGSTPLLGSNSPHAGAYSPSLGAPTPSPHQNAFPNYRQPLPPSASSSTSYIPQDTGYEPANDAGTGYIPLKPPSQVTFPQHPKKLPLWRRATKLLSPIATILTFLFSLVLTAAMLYVLIQFLRTRNTHPADPNAPRASDGSTLTPWPPASDGPVKVWPTYLLLAATVVSLFTSILDQLADCNCLPSLKRTKIKITYYVLHIAVWVVVAVLYKTERGLSDLWGWSCHMEGGEREKIFAEVLSFSALCSVQDFSWVGAIIEVAVKLAVLVVAWIVGRCWGGRAKKGVEVVGEVLGWTL
ncbi:uncharacterized protein AB675_7586 [Cyphellophora attinorum]|uniref:Uncharacterized protein n=1 Tax=Cyphellophora attinorum TaxID=1664694 RepID=A0A0N1HA04_9EURO|nr:uncharacterized protein AB675_7586 [Phialophora attinorum]KPI40524.1 hypothetical protein AB675_7586 [Phialophora attinorum]